MTDNKERGSLCFAMSRLQKVAWITVILVMLMAMAGVLSDRAYAGSMNGPESSVYGAACGTFEYDGKLYRAYDGYLGQLAGYMCRDDVDLTSEQASSAISKMYANVGVGVAQGYLYQVGGTEEEKDKPELFDKDEMDNPPAKNRKEYMDSDMYKANKDKIEVKNLAEEATDQDKAERESNLKEAEETFQGILESHRTGAKGAHDQDPNQNSDQNSNNSEEYEGWDKNVKLSAILSTKWRSASIMILILQILGLLASIICGILLITRKCCAFQRKGKKKHGEHTLRKNLRKRCGAILLAVFALNGVAALTGLGYLMGYAGNDSVNKVMKDTGIYHIRYEQLMTAVERKLGEYNVPADLCDQVITYSDFQFDCEKDIKSELAGKSPKSTHSGVEERVAEQMETVAYLTEKDAKTFASDIIGIYRSMVKIPVGAAVADARAVTNRLFGKAFILSIISCLIAAFFLAYGQRSLKKGMAWLFGGVTAACTIYGALIGGVYLLKGYSSLPLADDEQYVFVMKWIEQGSMNMLQALVAGLILMAITGIAARFLKDKDAN